MTEQSQQDNSFYVYEHIRKDTGQIFYVGKGSKKRAYKHDGRNQFWKRVVEKANGFQVNFYATDISEDVAFEIEIKRIAELKSAGVVLCNLSDGGEGSSGFVPSEDHKKKISVSKTGVKRSAEAVQKSKEAKTIKMEGNKFGRLIVLSLYGQRVTARNPKWICVCNCGQFCIKTATQLRHGREPSCGCAAKDFQRKKHSLIGQRFGRLFVLKAMPNSTKNRNILWLCQCDCGNTSIVGATNLKSSTRSCGCLHKEWLQNRNGQNEIK